MTFLKRVSMSGIALAAMAVVPASQAGIVTITVTDGTTTLTSVGGTTQNAMITGAQLVAAFGNSLRDSSNIIASSNQGLPSEAFDTLSLTSKLIGQPPSLFTATPPVTFTVTASETDFTFPAGTNRFASSGSFSFQDAAGRTASAQDFFGPTNALATTTIPAGDLSGGLIGPFTSPNDDPNSFSGNGTPVFSTRNPFSLTDRTVQTLTGGDTSIASTLSRVTTTAAPAVPEPATVLSLLAGIPVLGIALARRRRNA